VKTVLVCNQKGGVGKTLIADELAFSLDRDKIHYNFYDLDEQGSAIHKTKEDPDAVISIVDTPGALQEDLLKWIDEADFIVVPTMMSNRDLAPLERMIEILAPYKGKKPVLFVFNRWNRFNISKDFIAWFNTKYPELKTTCLSDSTAFNQAGAREISIHEYQASNIGCRQIDHIYSAVKYELNLKDDMIAYTERTA
jgi:chromosome partitioning protein